MHHQKKETVTLPKNWLVIGGFVLLITLAFLIFRSNTALSKPTLSILSEKNSLINTEKILIDGVDKGSFSNGKLDLVDLPKGDHQIIIVINGTRYSKSFFFGGNDISIRIEDPINVKISVWGRVSNKPIENVKVYMDEEGVKCTSNSEGICSFITSPEKHVFKLEGNGIFYEETKSVTKDSSSFTFNVDRKLQIKVTVTDDLNSAIPNAQIALDSSPKGYTRQDGTFDLIDVAEGLHVVEVSYSDLAEKVSVNAGASAKIVLKTSKNIEVKVVDELTGESIAGASVTLDNLGRGDTDINGIVRIQDVKQGSHYLLITYKKVSKSETISVSSSQTSFNIKINAPRTITVGLTDTETQKPIDGATVFLESGESALTYKSILPTDDVGKATLSDVLPGTYQIRLESAPGGFGSIKPAKLVTVGSAKIVSESLDMPNPRFRGSLSCSRYILGGGECTIIIKNEDYERGIVSQDTFVSLLIYDNNTLALKSSTPMNCGKIIPGQYCSQTLKNLAGFELFRTEKVVAIVFEGWKYTPQDQSQIGSPITLEPSFVEKAVQDGASYCKQNLGQCTKVVRGVIGLIA